MSFKVEIAKDEDFPELMAVLWRCFEEPFQGILRVFFPILNNDREASLNECIKGQREEYQASYPELVWLKVVDQNDPGQKIVGGAKWYFYERNPFAAKPGDDQDPTPEEAVWYPEGVARTLATAAVHAHGITRTRMAQRPHSYLNIAFTLPEYRGKGVAKTFLRWGLSKADELGLESWLEASDYGAPVYPKWGFIVYGPNLVNPTMPTDYNEEQIQEWEHYKKLFLPMDTTIMWRPVGGTFVPGETVKPWEN